MSRTFSRRAAAAIAIQAALLFALVGCANLSTPVGWSAGAVADSTLYVGTVEGEIRAVDLNADAEGRSRTLWSCGLRGGDESTAIYGTPHIVGGSLYVAGYDGRLYTLSLDTGELSCDERVVQDYRVGQPDAPIVGGPTVVDDLVLVGSSDGKLYALDAADGFEEWSFTTQDKIWSTPVVSNGVAYLGSLDQHLYALNIEDGSERWRFPAKGAIATTPLVARGRIHFGAFDSVFYAVNVESGRESWRFRGSDGWYWGAPVATETAIYVPSLDGKLYALNIDTGELLWAYPTESPIIGSPVIVGENIAIPSKDNGVHLVRLIDGEFQDQCAVDGRLRAGLTAHDGVIYLSDDGHAIRSLEVNRDRNLVEGWEFRTNEPENGYGRWTCG